MRTSGFDLTGYIVAALAGLCAVTAAALLPGCGSGPATTDPNSGLLRDFLDGKFDSAGHPLNATVIEAEQQCTGDVDSGAVRLTSTCMIPLHANQYGQMVASARVRVAAHADAGDVLAIALVGSDGRALVSDMLTVDRLRDDGWLDLPLEWSNENPDVSFALAPAHGAAIDVDYVETFPQRFGLVAAPGSGVIGDGDRLTFELPAADHIDRLDVDGLDLASHLDDLLVSGAATRTTTRYRAVIDVGVADLLGARAEVVQLRLHAGGNAARVELRTAAPACNYEGNGDKRVLITGFQPFPADGWHDNVSGVAVTALDVTRLRGASVMRLVMPVEYDRAAAEVTDAIARCAPDIVISFGQGGGEIALEEVAYNLQDTGEVSGGVPDNRGIIRAAVPIDASAPATRDTLLPLDAIGAAIAALGEQPQHSRDPGRYICNNVMFADIGAMTGKRAGFIHLPYTDQFDDAVRTRFAAVVAAAVQAAVDAP